MFASPNGVSLPLSPLNIYISLFLHLSAPSLLPCSSPFPSSTPQARGHPCPSPPFPPLVLRLSSAPPTFCVRPVCLLPCVLSPSLPLPPSGGFCVSFRVLCCLSVTRQPSGVRQCGSVGRCTAYMCPAVSPRAYVLPCVPSLVPCLVLWLVLLPAACCRLVAITAYTPLCPGRRLFGAASAM